MRVLPYVSDGGGSHMLRAIRGPTGTIVLRPVDGDLVFALIVHVIWPKMTAIDPKGTDGQLADLKSRRVRE
jgi:hypothetical protein